MKKLILVLFLFPSLVFAQKSDDFVTVTIKIVDLMDETIPIDAHLVIKNSIGRTIMNSKTKFGQKIYERIGEGQYQILLKRNHKYKSRVLKFVVDEITCYEEEDGKIDLSHIVEYDTIIIIRLLPFPTCSLFDNVNFNTNTPKSGKKKDLQKVLFDFEKSVETCNNAVSFLQDYPEAKIKLLGHASQSESNPEKLSKLRVLAVKKYLIKKGISSKRIKIEYFGDSSPIVPNDSPLNRALNRRVTFEVIRPPCEENE